MFDLLHFLLAILVGAFFLQAFAFFIECSTALLPSHTETPKNSRRPNIAVLVPAHNERDTICLTLDTLLTQRQPQDRIIVIADNCTDDTAEIARSRGVTVIERYDDRLRGKGYAMDFGLKFLASAPPDVVVAVDSDCGVGDGSLEVLASAAVRLNRPVQATYTMWNPSQASHSGLISTFALIVKNRVRPQGLKWLGLPCTLTGSGMAFPWSVIQQVSLANSKTVDDMQLALDLSVLGYAPVYCPEARVSGRLMGGKSARSQRSRWEHGHLETLLQQVPHLLREAWCQKRLDLAMMALDLSIPPLSLFITAWAVVFSLLLGGSWAGLPFGLELKVMELSGLLIGFAGLTAWLGFASDVVSFRDLLGIPMYILWKFPIYISFLFRRNTVWATTERD